MVQHPIQHSVKCRTPKARRWWVWRSTLESRAAQQISVVACVEVAIAAIAYWAIAIGMNTHQHLWLSLISVPFLLLRSPRSLRLGARLFDIYWASKNNFRISLFGSRIGENDLFSLLILYLSLSSLLFIYDLPDLNTDSIGRWIGTSSILSFLYLLLGVVAISAGSGKESVLRIEQRLRIDQRLAAESARSSASQDQWRAVLVIIPMTAAMLLATSLTAATLAGLSVEGCIKSILISILTAVWIGLLGTAISLIRKSETNTHSLSPSSFRILRHFRALEHSDALMYSRKIEGGVFALLGIFFGTIIGLGILTRSVFIRVYSTTRYLISGLRELPSNYANTLVITDLFQPVELVPGSRNATSELFRERAVDATISIGERTLNSILFVVFVLPGFFYRISIKSTFWLYGILAYLTLPGSISKNPERLFGRLFSTPSAIVQRAIAVTTVSSFLLSVAIRVLENPQKSNVVAPWEYLLFTDVSMSKPWQWLNLLSAVITLAALWYWAGDVRNDHASPSGDEADRRSIARKLAALEILMRVRLLLVCTWLGLAFAHALLTLSEWPHLLPTSILDPIRWGLGEWMPTRPSSAK